MPELSRRVFFLARHRMYAAFIYGKRVRLKYINKTGLFQLANGIIVGDKWFSQLPAEYQKILADECKAAAYENAALISRIADDYEKQMVDKGMVVIEADRAAFKTASEAAYTELGFAALRDQIYREIGK